MKTDEIKFMIMCVGYRANLDTKMSLKAKWSGDESLDIDKIEIILKRVQISGHTEVRKRAERIQTNE